MGLTSGQCGKAAQTMTSENAPSRPIEAAWEAVTLGEAANVALAIWAAIVAAHITAASVYFWREQRSPAWLAALAILAYWPILVLITCLGLAFKHLIRPLIEQVKRRRPGTKSRPLVRAPQLAASSSSSTSSPYSNDS